MYINIRSAQAANDLPGAIGFAVDMAAEVEAASGVAIGVWTGLYGVPMGTVSWSAQVESFATMAAVGQKLAESESYAAKAAEAGEKGLFVTGSFADRLLNVVHQAGTPGAIGYVSSLTATAHAGNTAEAIAFGADMADFVAATTGNAVSFCVNSFAGVGEMSWVAAYADAAAVDDAQAALMGNAEYLERAAKAGELFVPATGAMTLAQRVN